MKLELKLASGKSLKLKTSFLYGRRQPLILSKISEFVKTSETSMPDKIGVMIRAGVDVKKIENNDDLENQKLQDFIMANPEEMTYLTPKEGNFDLLYDAIDLILLHHEISDITSDDFGMEDILKVVKYIQNNKENRVPDFLALQGVSLE